MGNFKSKPTPSLDGLSSSSTTTKSRVIDKQIKADQKRMKKEVKLLLLGAGESGKSTVLKQMRLIHASGFKASEREGFRIVVFFNIFNTIQTLLEALEVLDLELTDPVSKEYASLFIDIPSLEENQPFPGIYHEPLKHLWNNESIQIAFRKGNMFALHDNISYFFEKIDTLWDPKYMPTDQDIIRCRAKTTGIVETTFHLGPLIYRMFDVGGQRSERKKWIHCFDNMHEALMLFDTTCNSHWFVKTSMILLLNKIDIFKKKITYSPIADYFPDYSGQVENYDTARHYFKNKFQRLNHKPDKRVYVHFTDATDTTLLQHVMMAVSDIILNENLRSIML
ncbi:guanine nucleotide-binding protein subunit alpha-2 [Mucor ambiguus]|uniref:Guanine nucleotide-binding protein subunit alpha-2 n=1 Tax=Mucor ambiguus TaxID=91626 RepID=A0A0C9MN61_9FUNG|nr:guanine nucleotide-binding protein subunit alpha-2 [Mucor ambiguus]